MGSNNIWSDQVPTVNCRNIGTPWLNKKTQTRNIWTFPLTQLEKWSTFHLTEMITVRTLLKKSRNCDCVWPNMSMCTCKYLTDKYIWSELKKAVTCSRIRILQELRMLCTEECEILTNDHLLHDIHFNTCYARWSCVLVRLAWKFTSCWSATLAAATKQRLTDDDWESHLFWIIEM